MHKRLIIRFLLMAISPVATAEDTIPIQVQFTNETVLAGTEITKVNIIATTDSVTVTDVVLNRGNCLRVNFRGELPKTLKFGQSYIYRFGKCNPIEIDVTTNLGEWVFKP